MAKFKKGKSGNLEGRPKGSTNHAKELRLAEEQGYALATNVCDVIKETVRLALQETDHKDAFPLIETIADTAKEAALQGEIGPSPVADLRSWYEDHLTDKDGAFFKHVGLPTDCTWKAYRQHYTTRGRIDNARAAADLISFPPIAAEIKKRAA